ncbi:MAG: EpsI family protein [Isosphaeraceae bacterium]|nr:EpsI family protein [Isosphaeraceae bacterium]
MSPGRRAALGIIILTIGLGMQVGLEAASKTHRPPLKRPLATLPLRLGHWVGHDEPIDPAIREKAQTDDCLNRVYEDPRRPGHRMRLWINYSKHGLNMRHSPEVCLPGNGWSKIESRCHVLTVRAGDGREIPVSRLSYGQGEVAQGVGFWYYIFGEGALERYVRSLPITSRSSHGRTTRGSGLTVEVFWPDATPPADEAFQDFAETLLTALEPILPEERANYYIP